MTITEQKAFLQTYTGKAQAPAHPAQDWADAVKELHFEAQTAPVEFANAYGVYERLTITYEGRTVTARVIRPASAGQHPLLLMYHDLNRGVHGWHHMTRFLALGFGTVALEAEPYKGDWLADPAQAEFRTRYKDALAVAKAALALPLRARYRNVTPWPRVQVASGAKVVSVMPFVIPLSTAHFTASAK